MAGVVVAGSITTCVCLHQIPALRCQPQASTKKMRRTGALRSTDCSNFWINWSVRVPSWSHSRRIHWPAHISLVSVQKLPGKSCYIMYEFWQDRISWMSYLQSNSSKDFQRCIIDMMEDAEIVSTMLLPGL
ncbi:hypothetical protein GOODEAATRI_018255 [Goodea atripinnis]|uniref:ABM domain-containing protein n=1 Tax=Goodea atripinnis TaxID=208336 RepID=A0ABV0PF19_9TELE